MSKDQERAAQDLYFAIKSSRPEDQDSSIAMTTKLFFERHGGAGAVEIIKNLDAAPTMARLSCARMWGNRIVLLV